MRILRLVLTVIFVLAVQSGISAQSTTSTRVPKDSASAGDKSGARAKLLSAVPPALYQKWKKYGQWDYKQVGSEYRDFTQFNFGATGNAAQFDKDSLLALAEAFKPNEIDTRRLVDPELESNFKREEKGFETLRTLAGQDIHLTRIAEDFTWLEDNTKWPREDVGVSPARWDEYRALFKSLSVADGIVRTKDFAGATFFVARANGLCTGGSSAGYAYSTSSLAPTSSSPAETLDAEARQNRSRHYAYVFVPLKPNWYIFYEVDW